LLRKSRKTVELDYTFDSRISFSKFMINVFKVSAYEKNSSPLSSYESPAYTTGISFI
jgi:hypothetical protein